MAIRYVLKDKHAGLKLVQLSLTSINKEKAFHISQKQATLGLGQKMQELNSIKKVILGEDGK